MATSEIERKLRRLRRRLRELIVLNGLSRLVVVAVGALAAALILDRAARFEAPGRLLLLLGTAGASAYALYRFLVLPLGVRLRPERLALLVERRHPELRERAKAINFGLAYGMGAGGLAQVTGLSLSLIHI